MSPATGSAGAPSGMPMSTTSHAARVLLARADPQARLRRRRTSRSRSRAPRRRRPRRSMRRRRWGRRPRSTGASAASMAAMTDAAGSRGAPVTPVPRTRVDDRGDALEALRRERLGLAPAARGGSSAASPCSSSGGGTSRTRTTRPPLCSSRAATRPSPPLLPLPQTIATGPVGATSHTSPARPSPARSMSSQRRDAALLDRPAVGRAHRVRVEQRVEPSPGASRDHRHGAGHPPRVGEADLDVAPRARQGRRAG